MVAVVAYGLRARPGLTLDAEAVPTPDCGLGQGCRRPPGVMCKTVQVTQVVTRSGILV